MIGCEGLWGTVLSILVVYPLAYLAPGQDNGSFENPFDAIAMITNNPQLLVSAFLDCLLFVFYILSFFSIFY